MLTLAAALLLPRVPRLFVRYVTTFPSKIIHMQPSTTGRPAFTLADSRAVYTLAQETSDLGQKVREAIGVMDAAIADYG